MDFPNLRPGQHAIVAAEVETGKILGLDGKRCRKDQPAECWRVFDFFTAAREFAVAKVAKNPDVEFGIFEKMPQAIQIIDMKNTTIRPNHALPRTALGWGFGRRRK